MMTAEEAREYLTKFIDEDGGLSDGYPYVSYDPGEKTVCLDGNFDPEYLEAIAAFMRASVKKAA